MITNKQNVSDSRRARAWYALDCPPTTRLHALRFAILVGVLAVLGACEPIAAPASFPTDTTTTTAAPEPTCMRMTPDASSALASALRGRVDYSHNAWTVDGLVVSVGRVAAEDEPWTACATDVALIDVLQTAAADGATWVDPS